MAVRARVLGGFHWPPPSPDGGWRTHESKLGCSSGANPGAWVLLFSEKTAIWIWLFFSWHWRKSLFSDWPQFGGQASMINALAISSRWATGCKSRQIYRGNTEKHWETKAARRDRAALVVEVSWSFLWIKTQQYEPDRLSGELDTQTITGHWTSSPLWIGGSLAPDHGAELGRP